MKAIVDCNSFYCSCERVFRPDLLNKPVVVLSNNDGCIISRTDEAKSLGIQMAGPYYQARGLLEQNNVAVFSSNYHLYGDMSKRVMDTLRMIVGGDKVEVYSVDEAFLDLSQVPVNELENLAMEIRNTVEQWTGIKVSVGVAPSKVLSKVANRLSKKDKNATECVMVLDKEEKVVDALQRTPIGEVWGVGRRYADKLRDWWGIYNALQLRNMSPAWAATHMGGVTGERLVRELRAEPCIEMKDPLESKKMIATTRMFGKPVTELRDLREAVATYTSRAAEKLRRQYCAAGVIQVFVVTNNYDNNYSYNPQTKGLYSTLPRPTSNTHELIREALPLVEKLFRKGSRYLKAGITLSGLVPDDSIQGNLFVPHQENLNRLLMETIDNVNFSMRDDMLKFCAAGVAKNWKMRQELRSARFTTRWEELMVVK
ncbi:MAG: SOS mutagenesis and repair protein UmuC [Bacteroidetes bacterium]|nr:MAG: SOS mutagenesis and repair protein UmuC [Bacteroidota bacterium]